jgi:cytochrome d ubiquinol oxidase subunit II
MAAGTVPGLGTDILTGTLPLAVVAVAGSITVNVAVQLRSRGRSERARRVWDGGICVGGVAAAFGWGAVITAITGGLALGPDGAVTGATVTGFALLGGLSMVALIAAHGGVFVAARVPGPVGGRARRGALVVGPLTGVLVAATLVTGWAGGDLDGALRRPAFALTVLLVSVLLTKIGLWLLARGRPWAAMTATGIAIALLPAMVFAGKYPALITPHGAGGTPGLDRLVGENTALGLITWTAGPVLLIVVAVQAYGWWIFRGRTDRRSPRFY